MLYEKYNSQICWRQKCRIESLYIYKLCTRCTIKFWKFSLTKQNEQGSFKKFVSAQWGFVVNELS